MTQPQRILEAIVTTTREDGSVNIAPMGPRVDDQFDALVLRPYQTSETFANLARTRTGVMHVTDDVELFARAALTRWDVPPPMRPAEAVQGHILESACRWYAFQVERIDDQREPAEVHCRVVDRGRQRDFFGFNRAMHAVIEAAIVATRIAYLPADEIRRHLDHLTVLVEKTGGPRERTAFAIVDLYVRAALAAPDAER